MRSTTKRTTIQLSPTLAEVSNLSRPSYPQLTVLIVDGAGDGGQSFTGTAEGGNGEGRGPGGNAYSGYTGSSRGGDVYNSAGGVTNTATASE